MHLLTAGLGSWAFINRFEIPQRSSLCGAEEGSALERRYRARLQGPNTPRPLLDPLNGEVTRVLRLPDVRERLLAMEMEDAPSTPEESRVGSRRGLGFE